MQLLNHPDEIAHRDTTDAPVWSGVSRSGDKRLVADCDSTIDVNGGVVLLHLLHERERASSGANVVMSLGRHLDCGCLADMKVVGASGCSCRDARVPPHAETIAASTAMTTATKVCATPMTVTAPSILDGVPPFCNHLGAVRAGGDGRTGERDSGSLTRAKAGGHRPVMERKTIPVVKKNSDGAGTDGARR